MKPKPVDRQEENIWEKYKAVLRLHSLHPIGCSCENKDIQKFLQSSIAQAEKRGFKNGIDYMTDETLEYVNSYGPDMYSRSELRNFLDRLHKDLSQLSTTPKEKE